MPSFNIDFVKKFCDPDLYDVFIETGTHYGGTLSQMQDYFEEVHTIELSEKLYNITSEKYKKDNTIFHLGDSSKVLPQILPSIDKPTILFLDGHFCFGDSAQGDKDCPLYEELQSINDLLKTDAIVVIDDFRLFGRGSWKSITEDGCTNIVKDRLIKKIIKPSNESKRDRLILFLKS